MQRIGTTKSFAQHQHSTPGKKGGAIQVLCNTSAQQNLVVRLLCTPQSVVHSICTTKNRGWRWKCVPTLPRKTIKFARFSCFFFTFFFSRFFFIENHSDG